MFFKAIINLGFYLALIITITPGATWANIAVPNLDISPISGNIYHARSMSPISEHPIGGDAYFIITSKGVVVIDTGNTPQFGTNLAREIKKITPLAVKKIIYTHWHWDHILGAEGLLGAYPGAEIIGHQNIHQNISAKWPIAEQQAVNRVFGYEGGEFKNYKVHSPTKTYSKEFKFNIGKERFVLYSASGETNDHSFVYLPKQNIIFVGDHFNPMLGNPLSPEGDVDGFIDGIKRIIGLNPDKILHGHSEFNVLTARKKNLSLWLEIAKSIKSQVSQAIKDGKSLEETKSGIEKPEIVSNDHFGNLLFGFALEPFVKRIYHQSTGYFSFNPVGYSKSPDTVYAYHMVKMAGGVSKVMTYANQLLEGGKTQLAIEIYEIVLNYEPSNELAQKKQAAAYHRLSEETGISNFYKYFAYKAANERLNSNIK